MAKARFTDEQIADFLQQVKSGVANNELCEKYGFSLSSLRRWEAQHASRVRHALKQLELIGSAVYAGGLLFAVIIAVAVSKAAAAWTLPLFLIFCIGYIYRFRQLSARHIREADTSLCRWGPGACNAFYKFCWGCVGIVVLALGYIVVLQFQ